MRYFLDTEFNGWGGALLSLALVPDHGEELYLVLQHEGAVEPWVERNVMPYLDTVPEGLRSPPLSRADAAIALSYYFDSDEHPLIVADWPEDIAQINMLLLTGPGLMVPMPRVTFMLVALEGFSTAANSVVPHNALHDARALRDHMVGI